MDQDSPPLSPTMIKTTIIGIILLTLFSIAAFLGTINRTSTVILPGGVTYLGPSPTASLIAPSTVEGRSGTPLPTKILNAVEGSPSPNSAPRSLGEVGSPTPTPRFTLKPREKSSTIAGTRFPYRFSYPSSLPLVRFPDDPSDAIGFNIDTAPQNHVFLSIIDISKEPTLSSVAGNLETIISLWWKQYSGLSGIGRQTSYTNKNGLSGIRVRFLTKDGTMPNEDVFFLVPGFPSHILRIANGPLDQPLFDTILNTLEWKKE